MRMALSKSIKMYLTIFIATTCIYMVLYQYHIAQEHIPSPEIIKNKDISTEMTTEQNSKISSASLIKRYNIFLWSPMSFLTKQMQQKDFKHDHQQETQEDHSQRSDNQEPDLPPFSSKISTLSSSSLSPSTSLSTSSSLPLRSTLNTENPLQNNKLLNKSKANIQVLDPLNNERQSQLKLASNKDLSINSTTTSSTSTTTTAIITTTTTTVAAAHAGLPALNTTATIWNPISSTTKTTNTYKPTTTTTNKNMFLKPFRAELDPFLSYNSQPPLYIITPTYRRPEQLAELTRLGYTLKHVLNLFWLVIEDAKQTSALVAQTLNRIGVPYEYLVAPMPEEYKKTKKSKPRGVSNRNRGIEWLRKNATQGVFYFADDDNTYDISIFEQMRYTKRVSMWPVGLVTKFGVSSPIIRNGKIDGFYDGWIGGRKFPVDMAGFAVSVKFLHSRPKAQMPFKPGYEEDGFLKSLAPLNYTDIELLASNCTEILTWHTQTKKNQPAAPLNLTKYHDTNIVRLDENLLRP